MKKVVSSGESPGALSVAIQYHQHLVSDQELQGAGDSPVPWGPLSSLLVCALRSCLPSHALEASDWLAWFGSCVLL